MDKETNREFLECEGPCDISSVSWEFNLGKGDEFSWFSVDDSRNSIYFDIYGNDCSELNKLRVLQKNLNTFLELFGKGANNNEE